MSLTAYIDDVDVSAYVRSKTIVVDKHGARESASVSFLDHDLTVDALRPPLGSVFRVTRDSDTLLEFGGKVTNVTDERLDGGVGGGTVWKIEAKGFDSQADEVYVLEVSFPEQTLFERAHAINTRWMSAKGWSTPTMASTGGPIRPAVTYRNVTVRAILDREAEDAGLPWRVNGDGWFGYVYIGSIAAPQSFTDVNSIVLRGASWSQEATYRATRLIVTTGGTREWFEHYEDNVAPGGQTHFASVVLPPEAVASVNNSGGYTAGTTSIAVSGLLPSFTFRDGLTLRADTHGPYTLSGDVTTDGSGNATLVLAAGLTEDVEEGQALTFERGAVVRLLVNGTPTDLDGTAGWTYDSEECQLVATSAQAAATVVRYLPMIQLPAAVRVWDPAALDGVGAWNYANVRDAVEQWPEFDQWESAWLDAATAAALELVDRAVDPPRTIQLATLDEGQYYPWMSATCSFPARLIDGTCTIQRVRITDVGRKSRQPRTEMWLLEGAWVHRPLRNYWKGRTTAPWQPAPPSAILAQSGIEVMVFSQNALLAQSGTEVMVQPDASAFLAQSGIEVMVA